MFFGILVALNLQTSFLTPPMAMSAYYLKGIAPPHVQLWTIFKGCFPFLAHGVRHHVPGLRVPAAGLLAAEPVLRQLTDATVDEGRRFVDVTLLTAARRRWRDAADGRLSAEELVARLPRAHRAPTSRASRRGPSSTKTRALDQATQRRPGARARDTRWARCTACRSASRTSSTPPTCRPRTARRCTRGAGPMHDATVVAAPARGRRGHPRQDRHHRARHLRAGQDAQSAQPRAHARRLVERIGRGGRRAHGAGSRSARRPTAA